MINLLPPQQKESLLEQTHLRLVIILGILFLSFLACLFLSMLLVKSYVLGEIETQKIILEERKRTISLNQGVEKEIRESNILLSDLNTFYEQDVNVTKVLEKLGELLPPQTYLKEFSFNKVVNGGEQERRVSLSGYCPSRESLLDFDARLEEESAFSDVTFSPSSWAKPNDIDFSVSFKVLSN